MKDLSEDIVFSMKCKDFKMIDSVTCKDEKTKITYNLNKGEDFKIFEENSTHFIQVTKKLKNNKHHFEITIQDHEDNLHDWTSVCLQNGKLTSKHLSSFLLKVAI